MYGTPAAQDYRPTHQAPGPCRTTQELMQIFGKGRTSQTQAIWFQNEVITKPYPEENQKEPKTETKVCQCSIILM